MFFDAIFLKKKTDSMPLKHNTEKLHFPEEA